MPVNGPTGAGAVTGVSGPGASSALGCAAFKNDPTLAKLAAGGVPPIAKGAPKSDAVKTMQVALFSLGYLKPRTGIDGAFGPGTEAAVKAFQAKAGLAQSGKLDANTLQALDKAAVVADRHPEGADAAGRAASAARSRWWPTSPTRPRRASTCWERTTRCRRATSPRRAARSSPPRATTSSVQDVLPRQPWNPPSSSWAAKAKPVPPGVDNPMGILKLSLGAYSEYIHGIPAGEEAELGHAASHGCLRMSGSNVLELGEKYAEAGTDVTINRDRGAGRQARARRTPARARAGPADRRGARVPLRLRQRRAGQARAHSSRRLIRARRGAGR